MATGAKLSPLLKVLRSEPLRDGLTTKVAIYELPSSSPCDIIVEMRRDCDQSMIIDLT